MPCRNDGYDCPPMREPVVAKREFDDVAKRLKDANRKIEKLTLGLCELHQGLRMQWARWGEDSMEAFAKLSEPTRALLHEHSSKDKQYASNRLNSLLGFLTSRAEQIVSLGGEIGVALKADIDVLKLATVQCKELDPLSGNFNFWDEIIDAVRKTYGLG